MASCNLNIDLNKDTVIGSGNSKTEKRVVADFNAIEIGCYGSVNIVGQEKESLEISVDDNILPVISTEVKDHILSIKTIKNISPKSKLQINVTTPMLEKMVLSGAGEVSLSKIKSNRLSVTVSGAGKIDISGEVKEFSANLSGAGYINAKELHAENANVSSSGAGAMEVFASEVLAVNISGAGNVNYYGNPKTVNKNISGIGSINQK